MNMFAWFRHWHEKKLAQKRVQEEADREAFRLLKKKQDECGETGHSWDYAHEVQGDGDPNVEGYILITTRTCRFCGARETDIEPYDKDDE